MRKTNSYERRNLRNKPVELTKYIHTEGRTMYAIRWLDNCIVDGLGYFQFDEVRTDSELRRMIRERFGKGLKVFTADEEWTWWGTQQDMVHIERLWNMYSPFTMKDNSKWEVIS